MAREAARRAQCSNNLKQIGISLHNYEAIHGVLPTNSNGRHYSAQAAILGYMEQSSIANALNFNFAPSAYPTSDYPNFTCQTTKISTFVCPSDNFDLATNPAGPSSYASNLGFGFDASGNLDNGPISSTGLPVSIASITDGLSSTAMFAEWTRSSGPKDLNTSSAVVSVNGTYTNFSQIDSFIIECTNTTPSQSNTLGFTKGWSWMFGAIFSTSYNHIVILNRQSCFNADNQHSSATAGSLHLGGANVLFGDGSVRFLKNSLALQIWHAIGTRNGNEAIGDGF